LIVPLGLFVGRDGRSPHRRRPRPFRAALLGLALLVSAGTVTAQETPGPFFRIFLTDGTTLTSYGDFARVGDRIVFSLPLGEFQGEPRLHLASVPADRIDWAATERYREATRAARYAETRGDEDFAILSSDVAQLLNDIALTEDPHARLTLAKTARARLAAWPGEHYGHRADEIRQILSLIDEVISDLRAATGESRFDISLVAGVAAPPQVTPLPPPSLQESIMQALWASGLAASPSERRALLEAALGTIDLNAQALPEAWRASTRDRAARALSRETGLDSRLGAVRATAMAAVDRLAGRADVRGVERLVRSVREETASLLAERGQEVHALIETLEARLDATRRLRLALDQWSVKAAGLRHYQRAVDRPLRELARGHDELDDIRTLAGPPVDALRSLDSRLERTASQLAAVAVPADGKAVHAVLTSAVQLAVNAVRLRRTAVTSGNMQHAWDASAAAAGALMLLDRARKDVARLAEPPQMQ
jgi:hypothetical protein